jgi:hypothetical protein
MKYGLSWDKKKMQLTVSRGWAFLFLAETLTFLILLVDSISSSF